MTKQELEILLQSPYKRQSWIELLRQIFTKQNLFTSPNQLELDRNIAQSGFELGNFETADGFLIGVFEVTLTDRPQIERNRVGLRNLLRKYYKQIDGAFVVFSSGSKWRFSFISEIHTRDVNGNRIESKTEPKRYTYVLGKGETVHTAVSRFDNLLKSEKKLEDINEAFSVEKVTKAFFNEIAVMFTELTGGERKVGSRFETFKPKLKLPGTTDHQKLQEFAVRMIGRIVFCWFLKKKKSPNGIPLIPDELLSSRAVKKDYYHAILEKLFFEALNTKLGDRKDFVKQNGYKDIPFLNGGLFEPHDEDFYKPTYTDRLSIPDEWLKRFFEILEMYNFTIDENTSVDVELSVDPEMLGRIFENLLAEINPETGETARKSTGSYYTPRPIVEYMVDESLKQYLHTKTNIDEKKLAVLLSYKDEETDLSDTEKDKIIDALDTVKILDPACGSGAFPIGMLQKMLLILQKIDERAEGWFNKKLAKIDNAYLRNEIKAKLENENWNYIRKLGIIQDSIYGVDIQTIAVEISKLRCFLTLVVDEDVNDKKKNRGVIALPNLEFKFVIANTLIDIHLDDYIKEKDLSIFEDEVVTIIKKLEFVRMKYFNPDFDSSDKSIIEKEFYSTRDLLKSKLTATIKDLRILDIANLISEWDPFNISLSSKFFSPVLMFGVTSGFDIVIGNPPYGFRSVLSKEEKKYFRSVKGIEFPSGDSAELFVRKCFDTITKNDGILTFIIPKKSLYGDAWESLRINYWKKFDLVFIADTGKSFENVLLEMIVCGLKKSKENYHVQLAFFNKYFEIKIFNNLAKENFFTEFNTCQIYQTYYPDILKKIQIKKSKNHIVESNLGLAIGTDFFSDKPKKHKLLKGIDIQRYYVRGNRFLDNEDNLNWKQAKKFLRSKVLAQRIVAHIENPIPHLKVTACYDDEGIIITNTLMSFSLNNNLNEKFWLSYLNSKFLSWYLYNFIYAQAVRTMDFYNYYIQQIPIPEISIEQQQPFITIVNQILTAKKQNPSADTKALEDRIDIMVYKLYDLTYDEVKIVDLEIEKIISREEYERYEISK